jgi:branched-chain amino acid transport system permease protein
MQPPPPVLSSTIAVSDQSHGIVEASGLDWDAIVVTALLILLTVAPPVLSVAGAVFWIEILNRVIILGLAATSLNLLIGNAGLISFGHAVYLGIGAYAVGISDFYGISNGFIQILLALGISALFGVLTGLVAVRTRGAHFIMITMAFGQMVYFVMIGLKQYGGDDGLTINARSEFPWPIDFENRLIFYYVTLGFLALAIVCMTRLRRSRFGLVLAAAKGNERRVEAVGFSAFRYRLVAYTLGGVVCGLAGFLNANFTNFVTPDVMGWTNSGELMFMVILGGVGTVTGPLIGAGVFLLVEQVFGSLTEYWHFWFGLFLIAVVLYARGGLMGLLLRRRSA